MALGSPAFFLVMFMLWGAWRRAGVVKTTGALAAGQSVEGKTDLHSELTGCPEVGQACYICLLISSLRLTHDAHTLAFVDRQGTESKKFNGLVSISGVVTERIKKQVHVFVLPSLFL